MKKLIMIFLIVWILAPMPPQERFVQVIETQTHLTLIHNTRGAIVGRIVSRDTLDGSIVAQFEANLFRIQVTRSGDLTNFRLFRVLSGPDYIIISDRKRKY